METAWLGVNRVSLGQREIGLCQESTVVCGLLLFRAGCEQDGLNPIHKHSPLRSWRTETPCVSISFLKRKSTPCLSNQPSEHSWNNAPTKVITYLVLQLARWKCHVISLIWKKKKSELFVNSSAWTIKCASAFRNKSATTSWWPAREPAGARGVVCPDGRTCACVVLDGHTFAYASYSQWGIQDNRWKPATH